MSTRTISIPFIRGIETQGDSRAYDEAGKFDTIQDLHVSQTHQGVLSRRGGVYPYEVSSNVKVTQAKVSSLGGRGVVTTESGVWVQDSTGALTQVCKAPQLGTTESRRIDTVTDHYVSACAVADGGADGVMTAVVMNRAPSSQRVTCQLRRNGITYDAVDVATGSSTSPNRMWLIYTSAGFILLLGWDSKLTSYIYTFGSGWSGPTTTIPTTNTILDVAVTAAGNVLILFVNANVLKAYHMNASLTANLNPLITIQAAAETLTSSPVGAISILQNNPSAAIIWAANYTDGTLRAFRVAISTGSISASASYANPLGASVTVTAMSAGGTGISSLSNSWCQCVNINNATNPKGEVLGALFRGQFIPSVLTITHQGSNTLVPSGKLWVDDAYFDGPRIWGTQGKTLGLWEKSLVGQGELLPVVLHSSLRAYFDPANPQNSRNWSIAVNGSSCRALLPVTMGADVATAELVTVGPSEAVGRLVEHGGFAVLSGGCPRGWDGVRFSPVGIGQPPSATVTTSTSGGSIVGAGVYVYALVWEWTDSVGRRTQSPPAVHSVTVGAGSANSVTFRVSTFSLPLDERTWDVTRSLTLMVYRSTIGDSTTHRRTPTPLYVAIDVNTLTVSNFTVVDTSADSAYSSGEVLAYGIAGSKELDSVTLESSSFVLGFNDRLLTINAAYPNQLVYTKSFRQDRGIEPNPALALTLPGSITGLAAQDGNVYAFTSSAIYAFSLGFADDQGQNAVAPDLFAIAPNVGCTKPWSIVNVPDGILFGGPRGIYMLPRGGGAPAFVGLPAEAVTATYPKINGAAHNPETSEVAFALSSDSTHHRILVFNYLLGMWFTWFLYVEDATSMEVAGGVTFLTQGTSASPGSGFAFSNRSTTRLLLAQSESLTNDGNLSVASQILPQVTTRRWTPVELLGRATFAEFFRVRSLALEGDDLTNNTLSIQEIHDDSSGSPELFSAGDSVYQFKVQRTQGVRVTLRVTSSGGGTLRLSGFSLEIAPPKKPYAAQRKG